MGQTVLDVNKGVLGMYREVSSDILQMFWPNVSREVIQRAVDKAIRQNYKEITVHLDNNYEKKTKDTNILALVDWIKEQKPIQTAYGVLFQRHADSENPLIETIEMFMNNRNINKKEMFKYPKGSEMYEKYNLFQLLDKIDCNAIYGILSAASSAIYNIYVAGSITANGRALISSATMFFEGFLANNVKFASLDEVLVYINNIRGERRKRKFKDCDVLDENITREEAFAKLVLTIGDFHYGKLRWYPSEEDLNMIWIALAHLDQEDINRIYYKNNLFSFFDNSRVSNALTFILMKMENPFLNPNKVPDDIKPDLQALLDIVKEYVFYNYQYIDAIERNKTMVKKVALISDTDSSIVSFDPWYHFVLDKVQDVKLKIGDPKGYDVVEPTIEYEFNFDTQEYKTYTVDKEIHKEDDNVRFSILNIIAYFCSDLINEYMIAFTKNHNSWDENKPCLIIMKNEFTFGTALLTDQKKHYASIQQLQEGNLIEGGKGKMDIKGLEMNKSGVNPKVKEELKDILLKDVLMAPKIDQMRIITRLAILEKQIYDSLHSGTKEYYKPVSIKSFSSYDDPMRIQGVKASYIWNKVKSDELPGIDLKDRNVVDIVKVLITPKNIDRIKESYPDVYEKFVELFRDPTVFKQASVFEGKPGKSTTSMEITSLAIPTELEVAPSWVFEFIDYQSITNDNIKLFPSESLNIRNLGNGRVNISNIIAI